MIFLRFSILIICFLTSPCVAIDFFEQRYRGWYWFENKPVTQNMTLKESSQPVNDISSTEARAEIEQFAHELEELKFMMLARPNHENVKAYRDKEKQMWNQAETLHDSWDMANLLYPEQRDLINNPVNVHGMKAKRALQEEVNIVKIKNFAKDFDLVLFFSEDCKYCQLLSPILKNFAQQYGFNIEAISAIGTKHEFFKTTSAPQLIERLDIEAFPTIIAISHDSKIAFELIRGYVSASELEEYSLLAIKWLENLDTKPKLSTSLTPNNVTE
jgi:conjugal transfer pilus assembly protein TraF